MWKALAFGVLFLQPAIVAAHGAKASIELRIVIPIVVKMVVRDGKVEVFTNARRHQLSYRLRDVPEVALP
jgi:hypothetical protein